MKKQQRKKELLDHPAMMAAVYLDPRVKFDLNDDEVMIARIHLEKLHTRVQEIKKQNVPENSGSVGAVGGDEAEDLKPYAKAGAKNNETVVAVVEHDGFPELLDDFETSFPYHAKPILSFWETQKENSPALYELACIINSIPPTQTTVERSISILNFVFNCRRYNLAAQLLEDILTIKLNQSLVRAINQHDMEQIDLGIE